MFLENQSIGCTDMFLWHGALYAFFDTMTSVYLVWIIAFADYKTLVV